MIILDKPISVEDLQPLSLKMHRNFVKAALDIKQNIIVINVGMHADAESFLLEEKESQQNDVWGINLHPNLYPQDNWIEFDSMVNLRPLQGNRTRGVDNVEIQKKIRKMVGQWTTK